MRLTLQNLECRNTLVLLANKFLSAATESRIKKKSDRADKHEEQAESIGKCLTHLETLISMLEKESIKCIDQSRVIAIQDRELSYLKGKVSRLEHEIQNRDL